MRIASMLSVGSLAALLACAGQQQLPLSRPDAQGPAMMPVRLLHVDPGPARLGTNVLKATVRNDGTTAVPFMLSIRAESPSYNVQKGHYRMLLPGETAELQYEYELPDAGYRLLLVYYGVVPHMPTQADPYPWFVQRRVERFAVRPGGAPGRSGHGGNAITGAPFRAERSAAVSERIRRLSALLTWDRVAAPSFAAVTRPPVRIGPYQLQAVEIATEAGQRVGLLFLRRTRMSGRLPTVLLLSGNPPGTKESGIVPGMILADLGFQLVAIDRRERARHGWRGGFLSAIADPVFDARRAVDYLLTRQDVDTARIAVLGYSRGGEEAMFLTVLHPSVRAGVFASALVAQDSLFTSGAWLPTLYSEDILDDLGLGRLTTDFDSLSAAITPEITARAQRAYRARYSYFDVLDPVVVLPLAAPKPVLVVAGARDGQMALPGALALDDSVGAAYQAMGVPERSELVAFPGSGHFLPGEYVEQAGRWLQGWLGLRGSIEANRRLSAQPVDAADHRPTPQQP